jgi:hypothetical protein
MGMAPAPETVARLMVRFRGGDKTAADQLVEVLYRELRRLAAAKMKGERTEHTWQPTLLINELYLRLIKTKAWGGAEPGEQEKAAFLGLAGQIMKRLLIEHARPLYRRVQKGSVRQGAGARYSGHSERPGSGRGAHPSRRHRPKIQNGRGDESLRGFERG